MPGAAAFAFRTVAALDGVVDVLSWWTFTDVFEEGRRAAYGERCITTVVLEMIWGWFCM